MLQHLDPAHTVVGELDDDDRQVESRDGLQLAAAHREAAVGRQRQHGRGWPSTRRSPPESRTPSAHGPAAQMTVRPGSTFQSVARVGVGVPGSATTIGPAPPARARLDHVSTGSARAAARDSLRGSRLAHRGRRRVLTATRAAVTRTVEHGVGVADQGKGVGVVAGGAVGVEVDGDDLAVRGGAVKCRCRWRWRANRRSGRHRPCQIVVRVLAAVVAGHADRPRVVVGEYALAVDRRGGSVTGRSATSAGARTPPACAPLPARIAGPCRAREFPRPRPARPRAGAGCRDRQCGRRHLLRAVVEHVFGIRITAGPGRPDVIPQGLGTASGMSAARDAGQPFGDSQKSASWSISVSAPVLAARGGCRR